MEGIREHVQEQGFLPKKKFVSQDVLRVFARTFVEPYTRISGGECGI